jgi:hypothetical protein
LTPRSPNGIPWFQPIPKGSGTAGSEIEVSLILYILLYKSLNIIKCIYISMASSTQSILVPRGGESNSDAGSRLTVKFEKVNEISEEFCYIIGIML